MKYPALRLNTDGSTVLVRNSEEAYASPETLSRFFREGPLLEAAIANELPSEEGSETDGETEEGGEDSGEQAASPRPRGRPRKVVEE